jgi:hypothetical protein
MALNESANPAFLLCSLLKNTGDSHPFFVIELEVRGSYSQLPTEGHVLLTYSLARMDVTYDFDSCPQREGFVTAL